MGARCWDCGLKIGRCFSCGHTHPCPRCTGPSECDDVRAAYIAALYEEYENTPYEEGGCPCGSEEGRNQGDCRPTDGGA